MSGIAFSKPASGGSFATLTGAPGDNTALAAALAAKLDKAGGTMTGALVNSTNGAASTPVLALTGTPFTGGTATTTKPLALLETTGATSNNWSTSGTMLGLNAPSGFGGSLLAAQLNGAARMSLASDGVISLMGTASIGLRTDVGMLMLNTVSAASSSGVVGIGGAGFYPGLNISSTAGIRWTNDSPAASADIYLLRKAASILALTANGTTTGAALEFAEQTAPSAPGSNCVRIYAEDNGSGKTRLMALFPTGAAQQIAIEP